MNFFLSICIPTRDRLDSIKSNIEHLISKIQENKLEEKIEIVISDNSKDENKFLLNLSKDHLFINYIYTKDLGHDYNILNLVDNSSSEYIWFCQDHTRLRFENINYLIKTLLNKNPKYVYLPTKNNLKLEKFIKNDQRYISFKNVYLNTNLVKKKYFIDYYKKLLLNFNGSHLIFQHAIIYLNFEIEEGQIIILNKKFSDYKFFVNESYEKNTWSRSLESYLSILEKSVLMFNDILNLNCLKKDKIIKIYSKNTHGFALLYQLTLLQRKDQNFTFSKSYINLISQHLTFNYLTKFYLRIILGKKIIFNIFSALYIIELSYLFFSPKSFSIRFKNKIINTFS